ncbi:unnamed protein product [Spirodela intermedia]|uniref:BZIP domain-containing protein n=1 Tax=Spirodela intermedia TaxID=51605 RepID=A0A7I8JEF9_SPIIN|nr:unnamed protein product [Spirodela intermedia]CAA6668507.1 unnamed protein product [Spirodela intermedia]
MASCASPSTAAESKAARFDGAVEAAGAAATQEEHQHREGSPAAAEKQHPMARQSSLLSLTLDEIQSTMCEPGKNFGSMNMDEFLTNIWTAEEGSAMASVKEGGGVAGGAPAAAACREGAWDPKDHARPLRCIVRAPSPSRRPSAGRRWTRSGRRSSATTATTTTSRMVRQRRRRRLSSSTSNRGSSPADDLREMTLEDFLIKAGVVREGGCIPCSSPQRLSPFSLPTSQQQQQQPEQQNQYGGFPMVGMGYGDHHRNPAADGVFHSFPQRRYQQQVPVGNGYAGGGGGGGRTNNGRARVGSPGSPVSSDGFGGQWAQVGGDGSRADGGGGATGGATGPTGRKRVVDGPVDRVFERRQRRMIKNRESAARSRARKQAYTVELETELNQLKEENARLQEEQVLDAMAERAQVKTGRSSKALRHCNSCVW